MSDRSNHKKDLFGHDNMKEVSEAIGDLDYAALTELCNHLHDKLTHDGWNDKKGGRDKLGRALLDAADSMLRVTRKIRLARDISKPFMMPQGGNDERSVATEADQGGAAGQQKETVLKEAEVERIAGSKKEDGKTDAIEFAEWLKKNYQWDETTWHQVGYYDNQYYTEDLYKKFKTQP